MAEFKDRGSKFLAYVFPCEAAAVFKIKMLEIKKEHPKAVHYCFAYKMELMGIISEAAMMASLRARQGNQF